MVKRHVWSVVVVLVLASGTALRADPKEEVQAAVKKLADGANYTWVTTTTDSESLSGATDGMTDKDGTTTYSAVQLQRISPAVEQGGKLVVKMDDGKWKSMAEVALVAAEARSAAAAARAAAATAATQEFVAEEVPRYEPYLYNSLQRLSLPPVEMKEIADRLKEVKKAGAVFTADLPTELVANLLMNRRPGAVPETAPASGPATRFRRPEPKDAKGTATFTLKDGVVVKYEVHISGTFVYSSDERSTDRTNTIEFSDIGTTKVNVPAEAKAKLASMPAETKPAPGPVRQ